MTPRPTSYALMTRRTGLHASALCCVPEHKMAAFLEGGWIVLIADSQIRALDIFDTYEADLRGLKERR